MPETHATYDVIVLGVGVAGTTVAGSCAAAGLSVAVVDERDYGGTCPLRGCDPKKVLVGAAEVIERGSNMRGKGVSGGCRIEWDDLMRFKETFTGPMSEKITAHLKDAGVVDYHGRARFVGEDAVEVDGKRLAGENIVVATGNKPRPLESIEGARHVITSEEFLEIRGVPERIVFIGGGYVSFEFAHVAARAGAHCTILHRSVQPLKGFDHGLVSRLKSAGVAVGVDVEVNMPVKSVLEDQGRYRIKAGEGTSFEADMVVHGAGRVPQIDNLDLAAGNVAHSGRGVTVDDHMRSVSNPRVWAAGDVTGTGLPLTPVAGVQGSAVAENIIQGGNAEKPDMSAIPSVVFTLPPLGKVGLTEQEAEEAGLDYEVKAKDTDHWYSQRRVGQENTGFKVLLEKGTDRILGAHVLGHHAEEVVNAFALAMQHGLTAADLKSTSFVYPSAIHFMKYML